MDSISSSVEMDKADMHLRIAIYNSNDDIEFYEYLRWQNTYVKRDIPSLVPGLLYHATGLAENDSFVFIQEFKDRSSKDVYMKVFLEELKKDANHIKLDKSYEFVTLSYTRRALVLENISNQKSYFFTRSNKSQRL